MIVFNFQLELTHSAMPPKHSEGFQIILTIIGLSPTHLATPPKRPKGFQLICSYGPTTTQQQGYYNLLQDLQISI
jgi:hypothetical protein